MEKEQIIGRTISFVKEQLAGAEGGHDWWHVHRVHQLSKEIAAVEGGNLFVIELGALLHDVADSKFHQGDETKGPAMARDFLSSLSIGNSIISQVIFIIENISYKGGYSSLLQKPLELQIVQDADRLDATGAIGIARTFNYGGYKNREMYNPSIPPDLNLTKEAYKNSKAPTINHFYEKLLKLKDLMNTQEGKRRAQQRHEFMELYLEQFYKEWNSEI
ncbi:MAG: HD domain-containing protein [Salinivirgaceae bacterium]|nr:HD domain-containing protein [Salinivirgaceae bacterium]